MKGLSDEERRVLSGCLAKVAQDHVPIVDLERLVADGRLVVHVYDCYCPAAPQVHAHATATPQTKTALELDTIARSGKVEV